jgi:23S rRNA maturation mini-RNase III
MSDEENNNSPPPELPKWFIDEGVPGVGDRPTWLSEKFKTTADLAKSHHELEKRLGSVPEDYDLSRSKYLDPDYEPFHELKKFAKDKRVPQDVFDKMIDSVDKYMDEFNTEDDQRDEIVKLGPNAKERLTTLNNWAKANLSNESFEALTGNLKTADAVKALEELRSKMMSSTPQVPNGNDGAVHNAASVEDLKIELNNNYQKYKTDENYRKDWQSRLDVAAKNSPGYVDKMGA